jgi:hypothetical protein
VSDRRPSIVRPIKEWRDIGCLRDAKYFGGLYAKSLNVTGSAFSVHQDGVGRSEERAAHNGSNQAATLFGCFRQCGPRDQLSSKGTSREQSRLNRPQSEFSRNDNIWIEVCQSGDGVVWKLNGQTLGKVLRVVPDAVPSETFLYLD